MVQSSYPICATGHCSLAQSLHTHLSDAASLGTCQFNIGHFGGQPTSQRAPSTVSGSVSDWKSLRLSPKTFLTPFVHSRIFLLLSDKPQRINVVYLDHKLARDTYEEHSRKGNSDLPAVRHKHTVTISAGPLAHSSSSNSHRVHHVAGALS